MTEKRNWTAEEDAELARLVSEGVSFTLISQKLNRPRNACIGRAHRMGLKHPNKKVSTGSRNRANSQRPMAIIKPTVKLRVIMSDTPQDNAKPEVTTSGREPVSFLSLRSNQCHAPCDDFRCDDGLIKYCGEPVRKAGDAYCKRHHEMFFYKLQKRSA
jgi:hypothetical protein